MNTPTPQQIIELAREAGFKERNGIVRTMHSSGAWVGINEEIERFAALLLESYRQAAEVQSKLCQRCTPVCRGGEGCFAGMPDAKRIDAVGWGEPPAVNLNCKSTQARLATLWGYVKPAEVREPMKNGQVEDCFKQWGNAPADEEWRSLNAVDRIRRTFFEAFRLAEATHGIGSKA